MREYFYPHVGEDGRLVWKATTTTLEEPLRFQLSLTDASWLLYLKRHFEHWGIFCEKCPDGLVKPNRGTRLLQFTKLPSSIAQRCCEQPGFVMGLVRKEIVRLFNSGHRYLDPPAAGPVDLQQ